MNFYDIYIDCIFPDVDTDNFVYRKVGSISAKSDLDAFKIFKENFKGVNNGTNCLILYKLFNTKKTLIAVSEDVDII